jgi:hypothetical protein
MEIVEYDSDTVTIKVARIDLVDLCVILDGVTRHFGMDLEDELLSEDIATTKPSELCEQIHQILDNLPRPSTAI